MTGRECFAIIPQVKEKDVNVQQFAATVLASTEEKFAQWPDDGSMAQIISLPPATPDELQRLLRAVQKLVAKKHPHAGWQVAIHNASNGKIIVVTRPSLQQLQSRPQQPTGKRRRGRRR